MKHAIDGAEIMKIDRIRTAKVSIPIDPVLTMVASPPLEMVDCLLVSVDTDDGLTGESYIWTFGRRRLSIYEALIQFMEEIVVGQDPCDVQTVNQSLWASVLHGLGSKGVAVSGISLIDWACWDILGKSLNASVSQMLGRVRDRIPTYASCGLWWGMSQKELCAQAKSYVAAGFRGMKMSIGMRSVDEDEARVRAVRDAIGPDIDLMADAVQSLSVQNALELGRKLEKYNLVWIEDPITCYDLDGHAYLAKSLDTAIATGEHEYGQHGFRVLIEQGQVDILLLDLSRVGGVRDFMAVAEMAAARDIPILNHISTEHSLQLCGSAPNCLYAEHTSWVEPLFDEKMELEGGDLIIPDRPGFGFTFAADVVDRFGVG